MGWAVMEKSRVMAGGTLHLGMWEQHLGGAGDREALWNQVQEMEGQSLGPSSDTSASRGWPEGDPQKPKSIPAFNLRPPT